MSVTRTMDNMMDAESLQELNASRIQEFERLSLVDAGSDSALDRLTERAAEICKTSTAAISLIEDQHHWVKFSGQEMQSFPLHESICRHVFLTEEVTVVPDLRQDSRFAELQSVKSGDFVFYASAPLVTHRGHPIGTICVLGDEPADLDSRQMSALRALARQAMDQLEARGCCPNRGRHISLLEQCLNQVNDVVVLFRYGGRDDATIEFVNGAFVREFDVSPVEAIGQRYDFILPREGNEEALERIWQATERGEPVREEIVHLNARGDEIWREVELTPVYERDEALWVSIARDITSRKSAEVSRCRAVERLEILSRATTDCIWDWDIRTGEVWRSASFTEMTGYPRAGEVEHGWAERIHEDDRERVRSGLDHAVESGETCWTEDYRFITRDDEVIYVSDRAEILRDVDGQATRVVGGMTDHTARYLAERRLRDQAKLLDMASDAILVRDLNHRIQFWNKRAEELYGWTAEEAVGKKANELVFGDDSAFLEGTAATLRDGEWSGEVEQLTRDSQKIVVDARWSVVRDKKGVAKAIMAINTDVTARKELEANFLRAQRVETVGRLAGGVAHDLNNILSPILATAGFLKFDEDDAERLEDLEAIEMCARRGADIVRQLLVFARGGESIEKPSKIVGVVSEIEKLVRDTLPKSCRLEIEIDISEVRVSASDAEVQQILTNLCVNAADAVKNVGSIQIRLQMAELDDVYAMLRPGASPGGYVCLTVEDDGEGMSRDVLEKIFDPFFTTKAIDEGTGLGLYTVHGIVDKRGGFIDVESSVGDGTRFDVYLPVHNEAVEASEVYDDKPQIDGAGRTVLVVDDEASVRRICQRALERNGFEVLLAKNGAEAVSVYVQNRDRVSAVLLDLRMPVMDGASTVEALRSIEPNLPIVVSSGHAGDAEVSRTQSMRNTYYLPKPYTSVALLEFLDVAAAAAESKPKLVMGQDSSR